MSEQQQLPNKEQLDYLRAKIEGGNWPTIPGQLMLFAVIDDRDEIIRELRAALRPFELLTTLEAQGFEWSMFCDKGKVLADNRYECRLWHEDNHNKRVIGRGATKEAAIEQAHALLQPRSEGSQDAPQQEEAPDV